MSYYTRIETADIDQWYIGNEYIMVATMFAPSFRGTYDLLIDDIVVVMMSIFDMVVILEDQFDFYGMNISGGLTIDIVQIVLSILLLDLIGHL